MKRTVKKIIDGDTFIVNRKIGNTNRVRIANYNAPERNTRSGKTATNRLRGMIGGQSVSITPVGRSYNRVVAKVTKNRKNVGRRARSFRQRSYLAIQRSGRSKR